MAKKIIGIVIAIAILTGGVYGFKRLGYWQRSVAIFKIGKQTESFEGRGRNFQGQEGAGFRSGRQQPGRTEMPDSLQRRFNEGFRRNQGNAEGPDSLRRMPFRGNEGGFGSQGTGRSGFPGGEQGFQGNRGGFEGRGRGEFEGGKKVSLGSVSWFLLVFAGFSVIAIYLDILNSLVKKRKALRGKNQN